MKLIEFIEKEPWRDDNTLTGCCNMYPNFMVKNGNEFFMFNRREPDYSWKDYEIQAHKQQLLDNDGAYFTFCGYENPFEMIREIAERKHHFANPKDLYRCGIDKKGSLDFHGNRKEVSAAFFYRIYDVDIAKKVETAVTMLVAEQWDDVIKFIDEDL